MNVGVILLFLAVLIVIVAAFGVWFHNAINVPANSLPNSLRIPILVVLDPTEYLWEKLILFVVGIIALYAFAGK